MNENDLDLLHRYCRDRAEDAFAEIVRRYLNLVLSAARRQVRSPQLAEEVAQTVFLDLARQAGRLCPGTLLAAWLYEVTRRTAIDVARREVRLHLREQAAAELATLDSATDPWRQIEPLLDEAMHALKDTDRAAVLLRFFEGQSLRAVSQSLGTSEDAAQKRVSRAVERLRDFFARHGVTAGAGSLTAAISANAVQAAPVGLQVAITRMAMAVLAGPVAVAPPFQSVSAAKGLTVALLAGLCVPLALLWHQNARLRREVTSLRALSNESLRIARADTQDEQALSNEERQWARLEHLELLSLRGRVAQLSRELRERGTSNAVAIAGPAAKPDEADSILFSAALTNRVISGQTLVAGGWVRDGMRGYLLATPSILPVEEWGDGKQLTVRSQVVGAPEAFWAQIGWSAARSEKRRSILAGVLTPDQLDTLLTALGVLKDAEISNDSFAAARSGDPIGIGFSSDDGEAAGVLMGIELCPRLAADGLSVDLELKPSPVSANTQVHSALHGPPEPDSSPAR